MIVKFQTSPDMQTWCMFDGIRKVRFREEPDIAYDDSIPEISHFDERFLGNFPDGENCYFIDPNTGSRVDKIGKNDDEDKFIKVADLRHGSKYSVMALLDVNGKITSVIFDGVAYICNDAGKTIEKVVGH